VVEMNLVQVGTNEFFPQLVRLVASEKARQPRPYSHSKLGTRSKRSVPLSSSRPSRRDSLPLIFVMEAAENRASHDLAVLGQGMSVVTLLR
jgi:hypothetical protein